MEDELYKRAKAVIKEHKIASAPFLQRKLYIGWSMATAIIDRLEAEGIVGPQNGARLRAIDMSKSYLYGAELVAKQHKASDKRQPNG